MNPLFFPGAISQFVSVIIFFLVIALFLGGAGYIYYQKVQIASLTESLKDCEIKKSIIASKSTFLTENIASLKKYCNRQRADIFDKKGQLLIDKIFQVEPR